MIPLSRIQVYNNAFPVTPEYNRLMATASCPSPTTTSSGLYSMHALYYAADSVHNKPKPEYPFPAHHPTSNHLLAHLYHNVLLPILPSDDMLYDFPVSVIFTYISSRYTGRQHIYFSKIHSFLYLYNHADFLKMHMHNSWLILNKLKHFLPIKVKTVIYNSLILSHIHLGILAWSYKCDRITKLQKRAVRIISISKYN